MPVRMTLQVPVSSPAGKCFCQSTDESGTVFDQQPAPVAVVLGTCCEHQRQGFPLLPGGPSRTVTDRKLIASGTGSSWPGSSASVRAGRCTRMALHWASKWEQPAAQMLMSRCLARYCAVLDACMPMVLLLPNWAPARTFHVPI